MKVATNDDQAVSSALIQKVPRVDTRESKFQNMFCCLHVRACLQSLSHKDHKYTAEPFVGVHPQTLLQPNSCTKFYQFNRCYFYVKPTG